jgi:hypothetical protein
MKHVWLILILSVFSFSIHAQLKMNATGHIGLGGREPSASYKLSTDDAQIGSLNCTKIGLNKSPDATYLMDLSGLGRIYNAYNKHIILDYQGGYYSAAIYPAVHNTCSLGRDNNAFASVYAFNYYDKNSDQRDKENINDIKNALDIILKMRGITYDLKKEIAYDENQVSDPAEIAKLEKERKGKIGFVGQELIEVLPKAVKVDDSTGFYSIDYTRVIPILVNAVKEQQEMILKLEKKISDNKAGDKSADEDLPDQSAGEAMLGKNIPNPFNENTYIGYFLPETIGSAFINIYDLQGKQIRSIAIGERGEGTITISGSELQPGMYIYCLLADKQLIGSEQMILTE